jgi:hypothetical protein
MNVLLISPVSATWLVYIIVLGLITKIIFCEAYQLRSSLPDLLNFLQLPVTSSIMRPNILMATCPKMSRDSSAGKATSCELEGRNSIPGRSKKLFSSPQIPDWLWESLRKDRIPDLYITFYFIVTFEILFPAVYILHLKALFWDMSFSAIKYCDGINHLLGNASVNTSRGDAVSSRTSVAW